MVVISLDKIVKNILLKRRYPLAYYIEFLVYAKDALREIAFDEKILAARYKCLAVNQDTKTVELPNDFQDYTRVSVRTGQYISPLVEDNSLQLVPNYDENFSVQPYSAGVQVPSESPSGYYNLGYYSPYWFNVNWNSWGENTGRMFGGVGGYSDTFKINKARNEIKLNENLSVQEVVLEYISNGMDADSATHIDAYAQFAIEKFAMWQFKEHNRTYGAGEAQLAKQDYEMERKVLRARISDLTIDKLKRLIDQNRSGIKY